MNIVYTIKFYDVEISGNKFGIFVACFPRGIYQDGINVLKNGVFFKLLRTLK